VIGFGVALLRRRPEIFALVVATVWSADLLALGIKELVGRSRPFVVHPEPAPLLLGVVGDSFPSGHAATSVAGAAVLTRYLPGRWPILFLLAVAIAFSRVYAGVHYPSDVLGGAVLGLLVAIALPLLARVPRRSRRAPPAS
jgi:undecaprenyl-diphosphatase